jgi:hypothetical protein
LFFDRQALLSAADQAGIAIEAFSLPAAGEPNAQAPGIRKK